jgi:branched-chain amino acid transport system permease protein
LELLLQLFANGIISGSCYALVAAGLALSYALLKVLNFAHGHLIMVSAYTFYYFFSVLNYPIFLSIAITLFISILLGFIALFIFIKPFLNLNSYLPLVATISLSVIVEGIISLLFGVDTKSIIISRKYHNIGPIIVSSLQISIVIYTIISFALLGYLIKYTAFGRSIKCLRENRYSALSLGINERLIILFVFFISILVSSLGGVLISAETNLSPYMANTYTIKAFACMIIGGIGNLWGTIYAGIFLGILENISLGIDFKGYHLTSAYKDVFAYILILLTLILTGNKQLRKV